MFDQPLPTLKESGGLNLTEWYSPGCRAFSVEYSGRGRALAFSSWPPAPPQALSAKTRSVASSPTTSRAAHPLRLLTPLMPIFPSPDRCGRERALSAAPPKLFVTWVPYARRGAGASLKWTIFGVAWSCLRVANFRESPLAEVHLQHSAWPRSYTADYL